MSLQRVASGFLVMMFCASLAVAQGMRGNSGRSVGTESMPLPEPVTLGLLALGAGGVGMAASRRKRRQQQKQDEQQQSR